MTTSAQAAVPPTSGILLGVVGDADTANARVGGGLAVHNYAHFDSKVPSGAMVSVKAHASWAQTAAAAPGSAGYADIVRWADTLRARGSKVYVAFNHEPESSANDKGTATEFKDAYRHVVNIFRARGASNVIFSWQMTAWSFRTSPTDPRYAAKWYPGDGYVDVVGPDAYNWNTCSNHGQGRWLQLSDIVGEAVQFARDHGKQFVLPEFASDQDSRRPAWLDNANAYLASHDDIVAAAFYFNRGPTAANAQDCDWHLSSVADYAALRRMLSSPTFN